MPSADPPKPRTSEAPHSTEPHEGESIRWPVRLHGTVAEQVETFLNRAQAQIQMQRWTGALDSLDAVLALVPDHAKARELREQVLGRLGR